MKTAINSRDQQQEKRTEILNQGKFLLETLEGDFDEQTLSEAEQLAILHIRERLKELVEAIEQNQEDLPSHYKETLEQAKEKLGHESVDEIKEKYQNDPEKLKAIDALQAALDIAGLEQTWGVFADGANSLIYAFRSVKSALTGKGKEAKQHLLDAGISAVSIIPFADVIKLLRLRKVPKVAKL